MTERQVDHAQAILRAVVNRPINRRDDVARVAGAVIPQDFQADDARARRQAAICAGGAGDDAGDVCAVAVVVDAGAVRSREIDRGGDAAPELPVRRDARVNHGDADAPAGESG